ncbi:MAG: hypothetical protein DMG71_05590, partial [Acidobacteria bacterium]
MNGSADTFWQAVRAKGIARQNANSGRNCQKTDLAKTRQGSEQCLTETRHMETIFDRSVLSYGQAAKDVTVSKNVRLQGLDCLCQDAAASAVIRNTKKLLCRYCEMAPERLRDGLFSQLRASGCWAKNEDVEAQVDVVKLVRRSNGG